VGTWHDSGLGLLIAGPLDRCAELLGVDLASLREAAAKVEPYTRADGARIWSLVLMSTTVIASSRSARHRHRPHARVVTAHDRAVALFRGRDQVRGHALLLCVMVFYTLGGIALLMGT
jgi:hypothetical protein